MAIALTEDHQALAESVTGFAARHTPTATTRDALDHLAAGVEQPFWAELVRQALHAVHIPEEFGGQGGGFEELAVVIEAAGAAMLPGPLLPTVLASSVVALGGEGAARDVLLRAFAEGATGAVVPPSHGISAIRRGDGWALSGASLPVLGLMSAAHLVVGAGSPDGEVWLHLDPAAPGVTREMLEGTDLTRDVGGLRLDDVLVVAGDEIVGVDATAARTMTVGLLAADAAGVMRWCRTASVDYAKVREQFGQPIGMFQAVKHKAARLFIAEELASAVAADAIRSLDQDADQQRVAAETAIVIGLGRAVDAVMEAITIHGGIAVTWEHDLHLYWRRAISVAAQAGSVRSAVRRLGEVALGTKRDFTISTSETDDPEFRGWVGGVLDEALALPPDEPSTDDPTKVYTKGRRREFLAAAGLVAAHWPTPWGLGATAAQQVIIAEEYAKRDLAPAKVLVGDWAVPTILAHGTEAQKERFAGPTLRGDIIWCQLFSEPQAGSDLASLNTKAEKVDGGWTLNGQKVWTSDAHHAHWAICLARTEPDAAKKHRGLSYFLVDMHAPGVTVRPLRQPSGDAHFNEVFLDEVFVPDDLLLGQRGEGWALTMTTLGSERTTISSMMTLGDDDRVRRIIDEGSYWGDRADAIEALGEIVAETTGVAALNYRESVRQLHGDRLSPGTSVVKAASAELGRTTAAISLDLIGPGASLRHAPADVVSNEMFVPAFLIGGGTVEIQLNVIAERILGLPRG
ncbi:acyl-CoA dehydrogenase [Mycobacterium antarcticum]|uniref:acyl-CoA dehydrogenase n=1 Tax=Mycolicibacterium sp. TUM20985 TaxID=3023370 RepID=UPI002573730E|nr:acyl-CoA dehydrogenase [Mycolicibacterium sp. TUM20985]BDX34942.1 acyl-CoA dehydrogenase [Mycolicibacterium sp. TUM20985]